MSGEIVQPAIDAEAFTCPNCGAFAHQEWAELHGDFPNRMGYSEVDGWTIAECARCTAISVWNGDLMIHPSSSPVPPPNSDLEEDIHEDYVEAAAILDLSPRSSAALLRLAVQKLMKQLGEPGKSINDDIAALVRKGMAIEIQQALDSLRVIGNNAVHPGEIDLRDDRATAASLFELLNLVAEDRITRPRKVAEMYGSLPPSARAAIEKRDAS